MDKFLANEAKGTQIIGARSLKDMVAKLKTPRKVMMLVRGKGGLCIAIIETLITIIKIQIHTFDKYKQFYLKMGSNKLRELLVQPQI